MNCDQVFDALTRGPFPAGEREDALVELHLRGCHGCRQLAEALRPSLGLIHESLAGEQWHELPRYRGDLVPLADLTERVMTQIDRQSLPVVERPRTVPRGFSWRNFRIPVVATGFLVAVTLGILSTANLAGLLGGEDDSPRIQLAQLELPPACLVKSTSHADDRYQCCTLCHAAGKQAPPTATGVILQRAVCLACHVGD
jgi:hypothetical protein